MKKSAIFLAAILFFGAGYHARGNIILDDTTASISPGSDMEFLEDADRRLTIRDAASGEASSRFRTLPDRVPNFGHTRSVIWLRFDVENRATFNEEWLLAVDFSMIDLIELYVPGSDGAYLGMRGGESAGPGKGSAPGWTTTR